MPKKKQPLRYTVHTEPVTEIDEAALNMFCRIAFGMNLEQTVQAVNKNAGGKYDDLFEKEATA